MFECGCLEGKARQGIDRSLLGYIWHKWMKLPFVVFLGPLCLLLYASARAAAMPFSQLKVTAASSLYACFLSKATENQSSCKVYSLPVFCRFVLPLPPLPLNLTVLLDFRYHVRYHASIILLAPLPPSIIHSPAVSNYGGMQCQT